MGRKVGVRAEPGEGVAEAGAGGERRFGEEEGLAGGMPGGAVPRFREGRLGQSAAGDEAVNVRVEEPSLMMPGIIISLIFSEQGKLVLRATPLQY